MKLYGGIDLGAKSSQICLINDEMELVVERKVRNDLSEIVALLAPSMEELQLVVESTFNWYWLVDGLQDAGFEVCLAHAADLRSITTAKVKTDRRDAFQLAKLLRAGMIPKAYICPREIRRVRDALRYRLRLVRDRAKLQSGLRRMLYQRGHAYHKVLEVQKADKKAIAQWFGDDALTCLQGEQMTERRKWLSAQITRIEEEVAAYLKPCREYALLQSVPGIGRILGATILLEVGEIERFRDVRHFSSYCRVVPGVAASAGTSKRGRAPKRGNPYLKWALTNAATHAVMAYEGIQRYYQRQRRKHVGRGSVRIAYNNLAHKLAIAVYKVLREKAKYDPELLFGQG